MSRIWRKVVEQKGLITLECGHVTVRKPSAGFLTRCVCRDCEMLSNSSGTRTQFFFDRSEKVVESWDAASRMPLRVTLPLTDEDYRDWNR